MHQWEPEREKEGEGGTFLMVYLSIFSVTFNIWAIQPKQIDEKKKKEHGGKDGKRKKEGRKGEKKRGGEL